jgi:hypothetical protein
VSELLYLDTARLGRMSPGAAVAHRDFVALAGDEGGGLYFDRFLTGGLATCPAPFAGRYPGLAGWRGVRGLKEDLRCLAACPEALPILLAGRSAGLIKFAARLLFHPCRNVLTTDLDWPAYAAVLSAEARRAGRCVTEVAVREDVLSGRLTEEELIQRICDRFTHSRCDGLYLTAVSNLGVRLPAERVVRRLEEAHVVRAVVVDGAQEFCHLGPSLGAGYCDLYLAGSHKWLGGYHPLGIAFYGRARSRGRVEAILTHMLDCGELDDPLLRFTSRLEAGAREVAGETVNLTPLFSAQGAGQDALAAEDPRSMRLASVSPAAEAAGAAGWPPLLPCPDLRSGILLARAERLVARGRDPELLRAALRDAGVAATAYGGGLVRLSMPATGWRPGELEHLRFALARVA